MQHQFGTAQTAFEPDLNLKSSRFAVGFRGTSRPSSAFIILQWFKRAQIYVEVNSLHKDEGFESVSKFFLIGHRFHVTLRIFSPTIFLK